MKQQSIWGLTLSTPGKKRTLNCRHYIIRGGEAGGEENLRQRSHKIEKVREEAKAAAEKLAAITVKIGAKVGENGKIFGSVTNLQVADAIKALGFEVERKNIAIVNEPIKQVGTYEAKVKFQKGVETTINFEVIEE